jgi:hypothetical protein
MMKSAVLFAGNNWLAGVEDANDRKEKLADGAPG